ncbi:MAG: ribose 5-phosphate isomerase B [Ignavibacteriaceae bacterium]|nr:ribose 5-phosphate isomerase B [Ignavibacteriaceae bacterium]
MKIVLGADHGGFELKEQVKEFLVNLGYAIEDAGNLVYDAKDDYPDFAIKVAKIVSEGAATKGIIICGSGVGACIAANKINGVRACVCHDTYSAKQGVSHDDMNVLCLGGRIIGIETAKELVLGFVQTSFSNEERHKRRLEKVLALEK